MIHNFGGTIICINEPIDHDADYHINLENGYGARVMIEGDAFYVQTMVFADSDWVMGDTERCESKDDAEAIIETLRSIPAAIREETAATVAKNEVVRAISEGCTLTITHSNGTIEEVKA